MISSILLASAASGFVYGITPGPGVLAVLGIGADQGRRAGAAFLGGHLVGDVLWASIALAAIIGVHGIGPVVFDLLGLISGLYLLWLGARAVTARRRGAEDASARVQRPLAHGLVFGLTNPKAYPVAVATFTALLSARADELSWGMLPVLVLASLAGGVFAYAILVGLVGAGTVRRVYRRHETLITRLSGVLFIGFAVNALAHAAPGLAGQRFRLLPGRA
ncbi:LysE family translocator [Rhodovastum atsumiense]|uniref:LysE family translocator n=1 Tax=Rhodovastum atsumiense TaxID=504468 RepID=A0A5M6J0M5_9PROT|nr:LysE family translocator [Rhodovastum atsumiense]KAA5614140.1 LysE family translocator [Rhodovastum atsumiense]CAH2598991.1 LysE family translocator [Rhodovastum atsumiense]